MRLTAILRETGLDLSSGTARAAFFSLALAVTVLLLGCADIVTVASFGREAQIFRVAGGSTFIYTMDGEIDSRACDALTEVAAVSAAGAVRRDRTELSASALPGERIPVYAISAGFGGFRALGTPERDADVLASADLAGVLGIHQGERISLTTGTPTVDEIFSYAEDGRQPGYGYSILLRDAMPSAFDACWVEVWPVSLRCRTRPCRMRWSCSRFGALSRRRLWRSSEALSRLS